MKPSARRNQPQKGPVVQLPEGGFQHPFQVLSSAIYSIYYSGYSTPYLSGEGKGGGLDGGGCCGERTRDVVIRRYRTTGIYTFG